MADVRAWDVTYVEREAAPAALRLLRPGSEAVLPRGRGARGPVPRGGDALWRDGPRRPNAEVLASDVRFYEITDARRQRAWASSTSTSTRARASVAARGWTTPSTAAGSARGVQTPVAFLTCNFSAPVGGKPALFTHNEVITLFHEFGHGLHQLLTQVDELGVSGMNGVEWDAVELPSQFMENFCWEWDVVAPMTRHVDTGARIPRALFDKMLAAKNFQSGHGVRAPARVRALRHAPAHELRSDARRPMLALLERGARRGRGRAVRRSTTASRTSSRTSSRAGTPRATTATSGPRCCRPTRSARSRRPECSIPEVGARFRREVLARGGSRPALESFVAFRGRKPQIDALLRHNGMTATA